MYLELLLLLLWASLVAQRIKTRPAMQETQVGPLGQEDPLEKEWQLVPVFLPGESHGQRSLEDEFMGRQRADTTERLTLLFSI